MYIELEREREGDKEREGKRVVAQIDLGISNSSSLSNHIKT